jgi:hypothetical protein
VSAPKNPTPIFALIEWHDSHHQSAWTRENPETEPIKCFSLGWIMFEGDRAVTIAPHLAYDDDCECQRAGEMTIPRAAILSIKKLNLEGEMKP